LIRAARTVFTGESPLPDAHDTIPRLAALSGSLGRPVATPLPSRTSRCARHLPGDLGAAPLTPESPGIIVVVTNPPAPAPA